MKADLRTTLKLNLGPKEILSGLSGGKKFALKELSCELGDTISADRLHGGCRRQELSWPGGEGPRKSKHLWQYDIWANSKPGQHPKRCTMCDRNFWTHCFT